MRLKSILEPISIEHKLVEMELANQISGILSRHAVETWNKDYVTKVMQHIFNTPGKMIRPALFLLSARSVASSNEVYSDKKNILVQLAAAIELLHTASLIHDDIIDDANSRRFQDSLNTEYGAKIAVLVGDILFAQFFSIVLNLSIEDFEIKTRLLLLFSDLTQSMCFGEIFQQKLISTKNDVKFNEYLMILEKKTALLMEASCKSGAIILGGSNQTVSAFAEFGLNFGYAFQIADDIKDNDSIYSKIYELEAEGQSRIRMAKKSLSGFISDISIDSLYNLCNYLNFD